VQPAAVRSSTDNWAQLPDTNWLTDITTFAIEQGDGLVEACSSWTAAAHGNGELPIRAFCLQSTPDARSPCRMKQTRVVFVASAPIYPCQIRVPSWRMLNGDKRAAPDGKVPGNVWDFPRVTGNSKQRRAFHPTQLNEGLVERAILLSGRPKTTSCFDANPFAAVG